MISLLFQEYNKNDFDFRINFVVARVITYLNPTEVRQRNVRVVVQLLKYDQVTYHKIKPLLTKTGNWKQHLIFQFNYIYNDCFIRNRASSHQLKCIDLLCRC